MATRRIAKGNNLVRGNAVGEGLLIGLGATQTLSWADAEGTQVIPLSGATVPAYVEFATGIFGYGFDVGDRITHRIHLPHNLVPFGDKFFHPHVYMADGATASGNNLVLVFTIRHQYNTIGTGETRGAPPADITITQTITPAELNAMGNKCGRAYDVLFADDTGNAALHDCRKWLMDDQYIFGLLVTSKPTISGGLTSLVGISTVDIHHQVIDASGTLNKDRNNAGLTFWGTNT